MNVMQSSAKRPLTDRERQRLKLIAAHFRKAGWRESEIAMEISDLSRRTLNRWGRALESAAAQKEDA